MKDCFKTDLGLRSRQRSRWILETLPNERQTGSAHMGSMRERGSSLHHRLHLPGFIYSLQCVYRHWTDAATHHLRYSSRFTANKGKIGSIPTSTSRVQSAWIARLGSQFRHARGFFAMSRLLEFSYDHASDGFKHE